MKYEAFQQIIDTMKKSGYDYPVNYEETLNIAKKRKDGEVFLLQNHVRTLIYAELSGQRDWDSISNKVEEIDAVFHYFDAAYLKQIDSEVLVTELLKIKCGNRQIQKQMATLKDNIDTLEKITDKYGSIDNYYNSENKDKIVKELSSGEYKMKQMGVPLVSEYLKNMGIDLVKPDVHLCRILGRLGYTKHNPAKIKEVYKVCEEIAQEYKVCNIEVDSILWQYCAKNHFELCNDKPNCAKCLVEKCSMKNNL